ncbi:MAG: hypothetical protein ACJAVT_000149, partial [Yoonia sp.]
MFGLIFLSLVGAVGIAAVADIFDESSDENTTSTDDSDAEAQDASDGTTDLLDSSDEDDTDGDVADLTDESTQEPDDVANDDDIEADDRITETSVNGHSNFQLELDTQTTEPVSIITDFETAEDTLSFVRVYAHDEDVLNLSVEERDDGLGANLIGPVPLSCRSDYSFMRPFVRKPRDFSSRVLSVFCGR